MIINTVNIIELDHKEVTGIRSFSNDTAGNKQAESFFQKRIKEHEGNNVSEMDLGIYLEEGIFDDDCGYQVMIKPSK